MGDAHVLEVALGIKQRVTPVGSVEQPLQQLAQRSVVKYFGPEQQWRSRGVKQAAVEQGNVNVFGPRVQHRKKLLEGVNTVVELVAVRRLLTQGPKNAIQAVALVEGVCLQQTCILVFKVHHKQQAKQQHHAVVIHAGQAGFWGGLVYGPAHDFKQRVFACIAVNDGFEVFFYRQRKVGRRCNGLLNGAGLCPGSRANIGVPVKEESKEGESFGFFGDIFQRTHSLQVKLDKRLLGCDAVGVINAPQPPVG